VVFLNRRSVCGSAVPRHVRKAMHTRGGFSERPYTRTRPVCDRSLHPPHSHDEQRSAARVNTPVLLARNTATTTGCAVQRCPPVLRKQRNNCAAARIRWCAIGPAPGMGWDGARSGVDTAENPGGAERIRRPPYTNT
jgi:hypothetical protein